jgi:arylsulfatase A-like enzyme
LLHAPSAGKLCVVNLVLIHTHDTGRWLSCHGAPSPSPNLERLAREGVLFRQAFCAAPGCSSSRAAMLTSTYPHQNGVIGLIHRGWRMKDTSKHLSHRLREKGYRTCLVGLQHEVPAESVMTDLGYETYIGEFPHLLHSVPRAEAAIGWLRKCPREPFFLNVGFFETHRPFPKMVSWEEAAYLSPPAWLHDEPLIRKDMLELRESVKHVDDAVGALMAELARTGFLDRTLVVFTTDHGLPFPKAKATLYDAGIGVALIMKGPGALRGGKAVEELVSHIDLLPTLWEYLGFEREAAFEGVSLLPMLRGETRQARDRIFAEQTYHATYDPMRAVRTERFKYIRSFADDAPRMILPNVDDGYAKDAAIVAENHLRPRPKAQLFDLRGDPHEFENRAGDPSLAAIEAELAASLENWMRETGDPILKGPVPLAPGGNTTPWDSSDPA